MRYNIYTEEDSKFFGKFAAVAAALQFTMNSVQGAKMNGNGDENGNNGNGMEPSFLGNVTVEPSRWFVTDEKADDYLWELYVWLIGYGINYFEINDKIEKLSKLFEDGYVDKRFDVEIPGAPSLKQKILSLYNSIIDHVKQQGGDVMDMEYFGRKFAIIWLDAEGLKAVNDTLGHSVGNIYLDLMVSKIIPALNPRLIHFFAKFDLNYFVASAGGDEMVMIIHFRNWQERNEKFIDEFVTADGSVLNLAEMVLAMIEEDMGKIELVDALNIELEKLASYVGRPVPPEFRWFLKAPGGTSTFCLTDIQDYLRISDESGKIRFLFMSALIDSVKALATAKKVVHKKQMRESEKENDRIICLLTQRNDESRELLDELQRARSEMQVMREQLAVAHEEIERLKQENDQLKELRKWDQLFMVESYQQVAH